MRLALRRAMDALTPKKFINDCVLSSGAIKVLNYNADFLVSKETHPDSRC